MYSYLHHLSEFICTFCLHSLQLFKKKLSLISYKNCRNNTFKYIFCICFEK